jgi:Tfp pilus assembly protein PilN
MIQLNLLPDVKLEYIKAQRARRLTLSMALLVSAVAVVILVLLLSYEGLQKKHLSDLKQDISSETSQLKGKPNIQEILTVQNQLNSLTMLHSDKPAASRLFGYLQEVTPVDVSINNLTIDFSGQTIVLTGTADSLASINTYVDNLKSATYVSSSNSKTAAFSNVVLSSFSLNSSSSSQANTQPASYTINLSYDQNIFDITQTTIKLSVPTIVAPRTTDLFQNAPTSTSSSSGGGSN